MIHQNKSIVENILFKWTNHNNHLNKIDKLGLNEKVTYKIILGFEKSYGLIALFLLIIRLCRR